MVNKISVLIIFLLIEGTSFSQVENISDWLGEWTTTYTADNNKTEENLKIELIHSQKWIYFNGSGKTFLDGTEFQWTSSQYLTLDNDLNVIGWYIDDNGYDGMSTLTGVFNDNAIILKEDSRISIGESIWTIKNSKLYFKGVLKNKNTGKSSTIEKTYTKKL